ncbi:hypothetical protein ASF27_17025 [Methylobacterium sp. Leaf102]|nr:hypothetical protein ASF27_17025 [Methylobacterium sp. Leaf102]
MTGRLIRILHAMLPDPSGSAEAPPDPALLAGAAALLGHHTFGRSIAAGPLPKGPAPRPQRLRPVR